MPKENKKSYFTKKQVGWGIIGIIILLILMVISKPLVNNIYSWKDDNSVVIIMSNNTVQMFGEPTKGYISMSPYAYYENMDCKVYPNDNLIVCDLNAKRK